MKSTIERAFELARSGECKRVEDVQRRLRKERFEDADQHLHGYQMRRQLIEAIKSVGTSSLVSGRGNKKAPLQHRA